jgi:hypothetical protein
LKQNDIEIIKTALQTQSKSFLEIKKDVDGVKNICLAQDTFIKLSMNEIDGKLTKIERKLGNNVITMF